VIDRDSPPAASSAANTLSDHAVLELVARTKCTAYDCEYAALALSLGTVLLTEGKALLAALPDVCVALKGSVTEQ
jgi:predicted nucleic acid-binding protein